MTEVIDDSLNDMRFVTKITRGLKISSVLNLLTRPDTPWYKKLVYEDEAGPFA